MQHVYLPIRSKSFAAEVAIRWFKAAASAAARRATEQDAPPHIRNNWVRIIPAYLKHLNSKLSKGSRTLRRMDVTRKNFPDLLRERYGTSDVGHLNASISQSNFTPRMSDKLFKFRLGQKVLVDRRATTEISDKNKSAWTKNSMQGAFGATVYTVKKRALRSSAKLTLIPVYQVDKGLSRIWLYEKELVALGRGAAPSPDVDDDTAAVTAERKEEREEPPTTTQSSTDSLAATTGGSTEQAL